MKSVKLSNKKRKLSSRNWLTRQLKDPYVIKSQQEGYRSRAAYKLLEIQEKFKLFSNNQTIIDLGAAPGGWSQIVAEILNLPFNSKSQVIAIDLLPIDQINGVITLQEDFTEAFVIGKINQLIDFKKVDGVISDMAANTTGHSLTDHIRIVDLCMQALEYAISILRPGGFFIAKIFQGGAEKEILNLAKINFKKIKHFKPKSSRADSTEMYLIAIDFKSEYSFIS